MAIVFKAKIKNLDDPSAVEKAGKGEGSRGGTIIGHTRSGKPIYARENHPSHAGFTLHDKLDHKKARAVARAKDALSKIGDDGPTLPSNNADWGFYGTASGGHGKKHAAKMFGHAQHAIAKLHGISNEQARNFLDSKAGRHLADSLHHIKKPTREDVHDAIARAGYHATGKVDTSGYDPRDPGFHPDNWEG